ncbi:hypothetical protein Taro_005940 [Colocasia esculenta]|uniref:Uncharacterized protein n=1 Tax=Colocasia esculenta TaxID=4460 RepID=A0A843TPP2_COLES|nr:hypothetical protein [Colocasia esculenta]
MKAASHGRVIGPAPGSPIEHFLKHPQELCEDVTLEVQLDFKRHGKETNEEFVFHRNKSKKIVKGISSIITKNRLYIVEPDGSL